MNEKELKEEAKEEAKKLIASLVDEIPEGMKLRLNDIGYTYQQFVVYDSEGKLLASQDVSEDYEEIQKSITQLVIDARLKFKKDIRNKILCEYFTK